MVIALDQSTRIAFYISKVYDTDIYRMKIEFMRDDDGKIYLHEASEIVAKNFNSEYVSKLKVNDKDREILRRIEKRKKEKILENEDKLKEILERMNDENGEENYRMLGLVDMMKSNMLNKFKSVQVSTGIEKHMNEDFDQDESQ